MIVDPPGKARHCTVMLLSAALLAQNAPEEPEARILARYTFLYADALVLWARRWRKQLARERPTVLLARQAKPKVEQLAGVLDSAGPIRDYLAAKRQPVEAMRGDDIEQTARLWLGVNAVNVRAVVDAAIEAYDALSGDSVVTTIAVDQLVLARARQALPTRETDYWRIAADSAGDLRPFTLPAAQGGELGRVIAQINDVANHLDVLLRLAPVFYGVLPYDWLIRSTLALELASLLSLTFGPRFNGRSAQR
jgi:hypothetical protein